MKKILSSKRPEWRKRKVQLVASAAAAFLLVMVFLASNPDLWRHAPEDDPIDIATPGDPPDDPADPVDVTDPEDPDDPPEPAEGDDPGDAIAVGKEEEPFILPAGGEWDRAFGYDYDETFADYRFHAGMDMSLPIGELILAVAAGEVLSCGADEQWGGVVLVQCGDVVVGYYGVTPASLSKGAKIAAGDIIGTVGPSPLRELGQKAHLHIEVTLDGEPQNPADYF